MKTKVSPAEKDKRENIVGVRYSDNEISRVRRLTETLALPVEVETAKLVRTLSLMALETLERKQRKGKKQ